MSENKNNMNFSIKINHISLLKNSDFNYSLQKLNIPKSKLIAIKELHNNKNKEKPFDIFFNPIQNINITPIIKENKNKVNPLAEKSKIIRKHNMLRRIDFNINSIKSNKYSNKNMELSSYNNINDNLFFGNNASNFNNNSNNISNLYSNSNNYNYYNSEKTIDLPILTINNEEKTQSYKTIDIKHFDNINLFKNLTNNNFSPSNICSPSNKYANILKKYMKVLSNNKKKNSQSQNQRKIKLNFTDQSMIMDKKTDFSSNFEMYKNKNSRNKKNIYIDSDNKRNDDESSSNDDNCDMKEIEKIISKSSHSLNSNKKKTYSTNIKFLNNSGNAEKKNYIFLNDLYRMKNDDMNYNHFNENRTSHNSFMKNFPNKINLKSQGNISVSRNHHYNKSLKFFNQNNTIDEKFFLFHRKNYKKDTKLMPYNYKK